MLTGDIITALQDGGAGTIGVSLFEGLAPDTRDTACVVNQYPGSPVPNALGIAEPSVQTMCRALVYADAYALATTVHGLLDAVAEETIGGTRYLQIDARGEPQYMGLDSKQRHLFVANFNIIRER